VQCTCQVAVELHTLRRQQHRVLPGWWCGGKERARGREGPGNGADGSRGCPLCTRPRKCYPQIHTKKQAATTSMCAREAASFPAPRGASDSAQKRHPPSALTHGALPPLLSSSVAWACSTTGTTSTTRTTAGSAPHRCQGNVGAGCWACSRLAMEVPRQRAGMQLTSRSDSSQTEGCGST